MRSTVWSRALIAPCVVIMIAGSAMAAPSVGAATRAPHGSGAPIHPGVKVTIAGVHCTVGAVLHKGAKVFVGVPGSCAAGNLDVGKKQDGCMAANAPVGAPVHVQGQRRRSILVYNSFTRMQGTGVKSHKKCFYNDFALIRLSRLDGKTASGAYPGQGAPHRVTHHPPSAGTQVTVGGAPATTAPPKNHGWVYPLATSPAVTQTDVGTPLLRGHQLLGLLTIVPSGLVMKTSAAAYNLHRAMHFLHRQRQFRHITLLQ